VLAVGVGAVTAARADDPDAPPQSVVGAPGLPPVLVSRDVRIARPDHKPGHPLVPGGPALPYGELETSDGAPVGRFDTSHMVGRRPMHLHRIELSDGVLVGLGEAGGDGVFTVVGASGSFAGASGSYVVHRGGDDSFEFSFNTSKAV
jgi:hypothetical protein